MARGISRLRLCAPSRRRGSRRVARWRFGVPVVCLSAGLLLAATHGVSGGGEIRRSDSPRLVDLVRELEQARVDRLNAERDRLAVDIDATHGRSADARAGGDAAAGRTSWPATPGWTRCTGRA